jgi:Fe(3+) dicitrate transport protein
MKTLSKLILLLLFFIKSIDGIGQLTSKDSIKKLLEVNITGEQKDIERLPILEGTRINAGKKNEVINLSALTADLSSNNYRQIMAKVPGVSIWESDGSGIQTSIATRGLSPNRSWEFNVRQNGFDISSEAYGYPEAYYTPPTEALDKIEVIRGAASLQYGTQFGGLLNYITKKNLGTKAFTFETQQTIGSFGLFNAFNAIGGKIKKFSYYAFLHHRQADGWRENSRYSTTTGHFMLNYAFSKKLSASLEYTHMNYLSQQPGGLTDSMFNVNSRQSVRARNWFSTPWNSTAFSVDYQPNEDLKFNIKLFHTFSQRNSVGYLKDINLSDSFNGASMNNRQVDRDWYNNLGLEVRMLKQYKLFGNNSALSVGLRAYSGKTLRKQGAIGSTGSDYDLSTALQQSSSNGIFDYKKELNLSTLNAAVFAENLFQLTKRLSITPGLRVEYINTGAKGLIDKPEIGDAIDVANQIRFVLLGGVGMEYKATEKTNFYSNISQAFRPVTYSELVPSATTDSIDQNLKDANGYNLDFGYRGTIKNYVSFDIGAFYLFYDNRIGTINTNGKNLKTNIGASVSRGIESFIELDLFRLISLNLKHGQFKVFANIAFIDARYTRWDDPAAQTDPSKNFSGNFVENAPRNINRFGITYKKNGFSLTAQWNQIGSVYTDALNTVSPNSKATIGKLDGYQVLDLSASYLINEQFTLKGGMNNVTNEQYATRRSGGFPGPGVLPGSGRTGYLSIAAKF